MKWSKGKLWLGAGNISKQQELIGGHLMEEGDQEPPPSPNTQLIEAHRTKAASSTGSHLHWLRKGKMAKQVIFSSYFCDSMEQG